MERLPQLWSGLPRNQRKTLFALGALTLTLGLGFWGLTRGSTYVPLYTALSTEDASAVTQELEKRGIPSQPGPQAGSLLVPGDQLARARMELAAVGLPRSGSIGFELFDRTAFGLSEFTQRVNLNRALQGELARSIASLEPIASARVHISQPQPSLFQESAAQPGASVVLTLKKGQMISGAQARGIGFLVARAVDGLKPDQIHILDNRGRVLWNGDDSSGGEAHLEAQAGLERTIERRVQTMLDQALGLGKSIVRVSADVDHERKSIESDTVVPEKDGQGVLVTNTELSEQMQAARDGSRGTASGSVGVSANLRAAGAGTTSGNPNSFVKTQKTSQYQVSRRKEVSQDPGGTIKRMSVAVLIDGTLDARKLTNLREVVASAAGVDSRRGDTIVLTPMAFTTARPPAAQNSGERLELVRTIIRGLLTLVGLAGGIVVLRLLLTQLASGGYAAPRTHGSRPAENALPEHPTQRGQTEEPRTPELPKHDYLREAREIAVARPEEASEVVRFWLAEE